MQRTRYFTWNHYFLEEKDRLKLLVCMNNVQHCFYIFFGPIFQRFIMFKRMPVQFHNAMFAEAMQNSCIKSAGFPVTERPNRTFLLKDPEALEKTCTLRGWSFLWAWKIDICNERLGGIEPAVGQESGMDDLLMFFPALFPMYHLQMEKMSLIQPWIYKAMGWYIPVWVMNLTKLCAKKWICRVSSYFSIY